MSKFVDNFCTKCYNYYTGKYFFKNKKQIKERKPQK